MIEISSPKLIRLFGLLTILFWLSYVLYLPPIKEGPDVKSLAKEEHEKLKIVFPDISTETVEKELLYDIYIGYTKKLLIILVGVLAGILMLTQKRVGRILALNFCAILLGIRILALFKELPEIGEYLRCMYVVHLSQTPLPVIHKDIAAPVFCILSIVYLSNKPVARNFN